MHDDEPEVGAGAPGPGWWQASDDRWYPPEQHPQAAAATPQVPPVPPDLRPGWWQDGDGFWHPPEARAVAAAEQSPGSGGASTQAHTAPPPTPRPDPAAPARRRARQALIGGAAVIALAAGALIANAGGGDNATNANDADRVVEPLVVPVPSSAPPATETSTDPTPEPTPTADTLTGTRDDPYPTDTAILLRFDAFTEADGSIWEITVGEPIDFTDPVLAENQFNDPPPDGAVFAGFPVRMTLLDGQVEPLSAGAALRWHIVGGSTNRVYDSTTVPTESFGCGVTPDAFATYADVAIGGSITGVVCVPLPDDDLRHPSTMPALEIGDAWAMFSPQGTATTTIERPTAVFGDQFSRRPGALGDPHPYGTTVDVMLDDDDAGASRWAVTVDAPRDITEAVLAENEFNDRPPPGVLFVGFEVEVRLVESELEPSAPSDAWIWEILGGSSRVVHTQYGSLTGISGCGVIPQDFDPFADLFVGGTVRGTICVPLPADDMQRADSVVALHPWGDQPRVAWGPAT